MNSQSRVDDFAVEVSHWFDELFLLTAKIKIPAPSNDSDELAWAEEWTTGAGKLYEKLADIFNRLEIAEALHRVDPKDSEPLIMILSATMQAASPITQNMYNIVNKFQLRRVAAIRADAEKRMALYKAEMVRLRRKEAKLEARIARKMCEQKNKETSMMIGQKALILLDEWKQEEDMKRRNTRKPEEQETPLQNRRRSRSLARRIARTVKKTVRRSISVVNNFMHHDES